MMKTPRRAGLEKVGATGFEPATARPPAECATRLRHAPKRATGIEPALEAWKASVQPQHFARKRPGPHCTSDGSPRRPRGRSGVRGRCCLRRHAVDVEHESVDLGVVLVVPYRRAAGRALPHVP